MINSNLLILPDKEIIIRICRRRENAENQAATQWEENFPFLLSGTDDPRTGLRCPLPLAANQKPRDQRLSQILTWFYKYHSPKFTSDHWFCFAEFFFYKSCSSKAEWIIMSYHFFLRTKEKKTQTVLFGPLFDLHIDHSQRKRQRNIHVCLHTFAPGLGEGIWHSRFLIPIFTLSAL